MHLTYRRYHVQKLQCLIFAIVKSSKHHLTCVTFGATTLNQPTEYDLPQDFAQ